MSGPYRAMAMSGPFVRVDADGWARDRDAIKGRWSRTLALTDLCFWENSERERPSSRALARVWGWSPTAVRRFINAPNLDSSPRTGGQPRHQGREEKPGRVYLIRAADVVKVGFTTADPRQRLRSFQTGNPTPLELLGSIAGTRSDEQALHRRFARLRTRGEWFALGADDIAAILGGRA